VADAGYQGPGFGGHTWPTGYCTNRDGVRYTACASVVRRVVRDYLLISIIPLARDFLVPRPRFVTYSSWTTHSVGATQPDMAAWTRNRGGFFRAYRTEAYRSQRLPRFCVLWFCMGEPMTAADDAKIQAGAAMYLEVLRDRPDKAEEFLGSLLGQLGWLPSEITALQARVTDILQEVQQASTGAGLTPHELDNWLIAVEKELESKAAQQEAGAELLAHKKAPQELRGWLQPMRRSR
jgi:hypothetical protein